MSEESLTLEQEVARLRLVLRDASDAMEWAFSHLDRGDGVLEVTDTLENIERAEAKRNIVRDSLARFPLDRP